MDKRVIELMRAFDESATQFTQFTKSLHTLKDELTNVSSELEQILELAEVEGVSDNAKLVQSQLQAVSTELNQISSLYQELVLANQVAKNEQASTLLMIKKQMNEFIQWLFMMSHQQNNTASQEMLSLKEAVTKRLISQSQLLAWDLTEEDVLEQSQVLKSGELLWLRHAKDQGLYLVTNETLSQLKPYVDAQFWIKDFDVYSLNDEKTLTQYHLITKEEHQIATDVQAVMLHEKTLIYVQDQVIKIK